MDTPDWNDKDKEICSKYDEDVKEGTEDIQWIE